MGEVLSARLGLTRSMRKPEQPRCSGRALRAHTQAVRASTKCLETEVSTV